MANNIVVYINIDSSQPLADLLRINNSIYSRQSWNSLNKTIFNNALSDNEDTLRNFGIKFQFAI